MLAEVALRQGRAADEQILTTCQSSAFTHRPHSSMNDTPAYGQTVHVVS
jgi:hypothetical protein